MKYLFLLLAIACNPFSEIKHEALKANECVKINIPTFYEKVCHLNIFQVDRIWIGQDETYIVKAYYLDVRRGCPIEFKIHVSESIKIECPGDI